MNWYRVVHHFQLIKGYLIATQIELYIL
jgi:hypothetical protein